MDRLNGARVALAVALAISLSACLSWQGARSYIVRDRGPIRYVTLECIDADACAAAAREACGGLWHPLTSTTRDGAIVALVICGHERGGWR